jgi:hypothetical protein
VILLLGGFAAWVGGALALFLRGFDRESRPQGPALRRHGLVMIGGFVAFVAGLSLA